MEDYYFEIEKLSAETVDSFLAYLIVTYIFKSNLVVKTLLLRLKLTFPPYCLASWLIFSAPKP